MRANVKKCSVNPSTVALGGESTLTVTLDAPAPPGGVTVIIDIDSDGDDTTLENVPQSIPIEQGQTSGQYLLQTQDTANPATRIIFIAHIGAVQPNDPAAQLNISTSSRIRGLVRSPAKSTWNWNGQLVIPFGGIAVYYIENDHKRYIPTTQIVACLGGYDRVIGVDPAVLAAWPDGPVKTDCSHSPASPVVSSPPQTVYSTSDRASSTVNDVQRMSVTIPPGYNYLGVWYRETTANPRPSGGTWSVSHGRNGDTVWVQTVAPPKDIFSTGIWIGAEFRVQFTPTTGVTFRRADWSAFGA
jgi:hypothetical protein